MVLDKDLFLPRWDCMTNKEREAAVFRIQEQLNGEFQFQGLDYHEQGGQKNVIAIFNSQDLEFVLVPGGKTQLGYEKGMVELTHDNLKVLLDSGEFETEDEAQAEFNAVLETMDFVLSPRRSADIKPLLVEREALRVFDNPNLPVMEGVKSLLAEANLRLLSEDEWEWCASGGKASVFRWGNEIPVAEMPPGQDTGEEMAELLRSNRFGLWIAQDPYAYEYCEGWLKGGDGGCSWCGGEGTLRIWTSLMIPYRVKITEPTPASVRGCLFIE